MKPVRRRGLEKEKKSGPMTAMCALCAHEAWKAESSSPPRLTLRAKLLLRWRRIGDLNPGGPLDPTAVAVPSATPSLV